MTGSKWPGPRRVLRGVRRHAESLHHHGARRTLGGDVGRGVRAVRSSFWALRHPATGPTLPVFVLGVQRSGTNALLEALAAVPEVEIRNEAANSRAFRGYRLRRDAVVEELVRRSRHPLIVFKPLADSHRARHLLDDLRTERHGRAVWALRSLDGRVRSALAKWPEKELGLVRAVADGSKKGWLAAGLSAEGSSLVRGLDTARLSPATASALVWYLRNSLYFELGLAGRRDVLLVLYERLLDDPERELRRVCRFVELPYRERMSAHVGPRPAPLTGRLAIDPAIRERCEELERRFASELGDAYDPVASLSSKREPLDGG